jgi:hypothetical protein
VAQKQFPILSRLQLRLGQLHALEELFRIGDNFICQRRNRGHVLATTFGDAPMWFWIRETVICAIIYGLAACLALAIILACGFLLLGIWL